MIDFSISFHYKYSGFKIGSLNSKGALSSNLDQWVNVACDSNAFVSTAGASISLNHQTEQIAQHSCVVEPRESNLSGADSKENSESSEEMDFVGVQKHKVRRLYLGGVRECVLGRSQP